MAMDKDRLLQYFQQHYLSRQEVLFKLPLNVSIDTFWPELLNRRKAGAIILPLSNAAGMTIASRSSTVQACTSSICRSSLISICTCLG